MAKELKCPNCGAAAVQKQDGCCVCTNKECGGTFTFKEGEARLAGVGEYEQLKGKVEQIEAHQAEIDELVGRKPKPDEILPDDPPADPHGNDPEDDEEEEDW